MTNATSHHPPEELLAQAGAALNRGDSQQAGSLAMRVLQVDPRHPEANYVAGLAAMALRRLPQALEHLHKAASLQPRHAGYAVQFARALVRAHRTGEALQVANVALSLDPADPMLLDLLGTVYMQCHAHERAGALYRRAAGLLPDNPTCRFNYATSLVLSGDVVLAERELDACLALAPDYWPAYNVRSRLRRQSPARNHVEHLRALARQADDPRAKFQLHTALAKEYEDLGEYAKAFEHLVTGKAANRGARQYSIQRDEAVVEALIHRFPEVQPQPSACLSDEPIFVMGMPRTGTTLVERILSSHPEVYAAGELQNFGVMLERLSGGRSPVMLDANVIDRTRHIHWQQLGDLYLSSTRPATSLKPRFIDKLPHNFLYAGFIANALPNAKMICLRRNPLDSCLSNFREPFTESSPLHGYSFDLLDTGRYYILFDRLMAHWQRVLPGRILEVDYETLVTEPETSTRQLLEHCRLPWNDACLHSEHNRAPATTASAVQVRAPIHQAAVGRWKKYAAQLGELQELLGSAGISSDR
ncbi:tetratricopeptide repeat-containing sulfotransferase family protein [Rhodanobacter spathiphylli]|uniref:Putative sulfotransferase n=1 Tax=Rhodanobacter spathiphylli B39 TaxID=1163407 RepID=I4W305_9GAMM|nr:sulfotransferase [Rhodanobacter spathiphylli]EIL93846.1 putative sulfotransferase [Rhodanobacter spathiphylli B39]